MTRKVSYYYDNDVGTYAYSLHHPMKPHRIKMAHNLIVNYGLDKHLDIIRPARATPHKMTSFHTDEYIDFLSRVTPETVEELTGRETRYLIGTDCPAFEGLWEFCAISAGGSIAGAQRLNSGLSDIAVNWAGGLHHAKKREASGFCYVNDIVLAILEFLRVHARVLYIDIDVHHGDGVEEAFYTTDRVMTCSFHKFGDFFPGTGDLHDRGIGKGKGYSVNVPLRDGIDDDSYRGVFRPVIQAIMDWYRPGAVILQCGADSLAEDKLGSFNLSMKGHADCVTFVKTFNIPMMVLGGGGYTIRNVARTWAYETGVLAGIDLNENNPHLPFNEYMEYFGPEFRMDVPNNNMDNQNSREYLDGIRSSVIDGLRHLPFAPSVGMQNVPPPLPEVEYDSDEDLDTRISQRTRDAHTQRYGDDLSSDDEAEPTTSYSSFGRKRTQPVQADELATHPSGRRKRRPRGASPPPNVMELDEEEPVTNERPKRTFFQPSPISPFEGAALNSELAAMKRKVPVE